mmetsp:Transcript_19316/g.28782  ORF Transcript_19316/g.28782 Transcript_19316/m.28782 type:complete len:214 (+) Transcript_19316:90-731(+)
MSGHTQRKYEGVKYKLSDFASTSQIEWIQGEPIEIGCGIPVVLELWATWCPPCRDSIPHLNDLANANPEVAIVGVTSENVGTAQPFVKNMGNKMTYRVASSAKLTSAISSVIGSKGIPTAAVFSAEGEIIWHGHPMEQQFETTIKNLNNKAAKQKKKEKLLSEVYTEEDLKKKSIRELKQLLVVFNLSASGLLEKNDFIEAILKAQTSNQPSL